MTDEFNNDLTQDERAVLASIPNPAGSLATDDSGMFRITNPLTGGGLFTSNMNPLVSGIDPLTGGTALAGTDILFGAPVRRYLSSKVVNGAMEEPPLDITSPISEDNPLPGWKWVNESGSAFDAYWVTVGAGALNGQVNVRMRSGAAGDLSYLEQLVPVNPSQGFVWYYRVIPFVNGTVDMDAYVTCQFIDATGATTGSAATDSGDLSANVPLYPDTDGSASGIASWLRVRVGFQRNAGAAATATSAFGTIGEIAVNESNAHGLWDYQSGSWTPTLTCDTPGDLSVAYTTRLGQYTKINRLVFLSWTVVTSTWTHSTASGSLRLTTAPFTALTSSGMNWLGGGVLRYTKASYSQVQPLIASGGTTIFHRTVGSGQAITNIQISETPSGTQVTAEGSLVYIAA